MIMADLTNKMGKKSDVKTYKKLAENCKIAFNNRFYNARRKSLYDVLGDKSILGIKLSGHSEGQIGIYIPEYKILFSADSSWGSTFNEEIKNINRDYRDKDSVTDVISFALEEDEVNIIPDDAPRTLGDIVISSDRAKEQAADYGHSYRRELLFLSLHGFLHLLGYDHMESDEEAVMNGKQEEILNAYGVTRD